MATLYGLYSSETPFLMERKLNSEYLSSSERRAVVRSAQHQRQGGLLQPGQHRRVPGHAADVAPLAVAERGAPQQRRRIGKFLALPEELAEAQLEGERL